MSSNFSLGAPTDVIEELFDCDEGVKQDFQNHLAPQVLEFSEAFSPVFSTFENFMRDCVDNRQAAIVCSLMHGVLDDTLTAVKLMLSGKLSASGNLARQATEGICMAIMCAHSDLLLIGEREQIYWQLFWDQDNAAKRHLATKQVTRNLERLGLTEEGAGYLKRAVEARNGHSHAGQLAIANRVDLGAKGQIYFGGHFDPEKLKGYCLELAHNTMVCNWAQETFNILWPKIKVLPKDVAK